MMICLISCHDRDICTSKGKDEVLLQKRKSGIPIAESSVETKLSIQFYAEIIAFSPIPARLALTNICPEA